MEEKEFGLKEELDNERKKVFVDHFDLTVREVVRMATEEGPEGGKELNISPTYQRKFRWSESDESKLIESIFLELPVPPIFVAGNKDGTWEVVDGLQRISTLIHFVEEEKDKLSIVNKNEPLQLKSLKRLPKFNEKTYNELPRSIQFDFRKRYLRITVLSDKSDRQVRYDLFERLNKQGIELTPQEIRACIYRGGLIDFVSELASNEKFKKLLKLQRGNESDGTKEEIVLKFFAFKNDRKSYSGSVKKFLNDYTEKNRGNTEIYAESDIFEKAIEEVYRIVEPPFLRDSGGPTTPLNQIEGVLVGAGELIQEGKEDFNPKTGWKEDAELVYHSTNGTNARKKLIGRIERAKELLMGADVKDQYEG